MNAPNTETPNSHRAVALQLLEEHRQKFGQAFERFYRPQIVEKHELSLAAIAEEPLHPITENNSGGLKNPAFVESLKKNARELSSALYDLAAKGWEKNINLYLKAIDDRTAEYTTEEIRVLMEHVDNYFHKDYESDRLERGESSELIDQIVKRTGEATREQMVKVLAGVNVQQVARNIWDIYFSGELDAGPKIEAILLDLTDHQVREVRLQFSDLSARFIARQLHDCFIPWNIPIERDEEIEIVEYDPHELHKKLQNLKSGKPSEEEEDDDDDFFPEYDLKGMHYLLKGHPSDSIRRIEQIFNEEYSGLLGGELRELVDTLLPEDDQPEIRVLLEGVQLGKIASAINEVLAKYDTEPPETPPLLATAPKFPEVIPEYRKIVQKRHLYSNGITPRDVEIEGIPEITLLTEYLTTEQFDELNEHLSKDHQHTLDKRFYRQSAPLWPSRKVWEVRDSLTREEPFERLLERIAYLNPGELTNFRIAFRAATGKEFEATVLPSISTDQFSVEERLKQRTLSIRCSGVCRAELSLDLLALFRGELERSGHSLIKEADEEESLAVATKELGNEKLTVENCRAAIKAITPQKRFFLEDIYYVKNGVPLLSKLSKQFSKDEVKELAVLLLGSDVQELVTALDRDPTQMAELYPLTTPEIKALLNPSLVDTLVEMSISEGESALAAEESLFVSYRPEAQKVFHLFAGHLKAGTQVPLESKELFNLPYPYAAAFEKSYCIYFGSLRQQLKALLSKDLVSPPLFSSIISRLEGIESEPLKSLGEAIQSGDNERLQDIFFEIAFHCRTLEDLFPVQRSGKSLVAELTEMKGDEAEIDKTILYFLGYYPDLVSERVEEALQKLSGEKLQDELSLIFADPFDEETPNFLLPPDFNWITEMYIQIRREFQQSQDKSLMAALFESDLDSAFVHKLQIQLFGTDMVGHAEGLTRAYAGESEVDVAGYINQELAKFPARYLSSLSELFDALHPETTLMDVVKGLKSEGAKDALKIMTKKPKKRNEQEKTKSKEGSSPSEEKSETSES